MRIIKNNPISKLVNSYLIDASQPTNISYLWNFGSLLAFCLIIQIITGVTLAMHYSPSILEAFNSVEHKLMSQLWFFLVSFFCVQNFKDANLDFFVLNLIYYVCPFKAQTFFHSLSTLNNEIQPFRNNSLNSDASDKTDHDNNFYEWFRGFTDAEGCFIIQPRDNKYFYFKFEIYLHKDDALLLEYIAKKLGVGKVYIREHFATFTVVNKDDLHIIIDLFTNNPLNTSKNLNFLLWKKGCELYYNRKSLEDVTNKDLNKLTKEILNLKDQMNRNRVDFKQPDNHSINITPYWLLGFVEGEGYFSVVLKDLRLIFGIGQTASELEVMKAIQKFLLGLPGDYTLSRVDSNIVSLTVLEKTRNVNQNPMVNIAINKMDYLTNVLLPFFDKLTWFSKKKLDFEDWKLILKIKNQGKHFTEEGLELITLLANGLNRARLTTYSNTNSNVNNEELYNKINTLLASPSNYELHSNGKILIISKGIYLKGRGNISINAFDRRLENNELVFKFNSIKECAQFFKVSERTINRKLDKGTSIEFNGKLLTLKRNVSLL